MNGIKEGKYVEVDGIRLHYQEEGAGDPVLLLHGWPTSSFLYRNIMPSIAAQGKRVLALDLPGFGLSDKPLDQAYSFRFFQKTLDGFLEKVGVNDLHLAVHDLGGPVGVYWATANVKRVRSLTILNTLIYPEMSWAVKVFIIALRLPLVRDFLASPAGLRFGMRAGVKDRKRHTPEMYAGVTQPFQTNDARKALLKAGGDLNPKGFFLMAQRLPQFKCPVRVIYGEADGILPDIAETVARIQKDLPQAEVTSIPGCGHFLQEDRPEEVARLMADFYEKN